MAPPSWSLVDCEARHREHPGTFELPSRSRRTHLRYGDLAQLIFTNGATSGCVAERMWVRVIERASQGRYVGMLDNTPDTIRDLKHGDRVAFEARHIAKVE